MSVTGEVLSSPACGYASARCTPGANIPCSWQRTTALRPSADLSCPRRPADLRNVRFIGEHGRHHAARDRRVGMAEQVTHLVDDR